MPSPKYHIRITGALGCLVILLPIIITATAAALTTYLIFTH
jgi:hypothetical protein